MVLQLTEQILPSSMEICWKTELFTAFYKMVHNIRHSFVIGNVTEFFSQTEYVWLLGLRI